MNHSITNRLMRLMLYFIVVLLVIIWIGTIDKSSLRAATLNCTGVIQQERSAEESNSLGEEALKESKTLIQKGTAESYRMAIEKLIQANQFFRAANAKQSEAKTLLALGNIYDLLGEKQKALEYYNAALSLQRAVGVKKGEAITLNCIGTVYSAIGEQQKALEHYNAALQLFKSVGDKRGEASSLNSIGSLYSVLGEKQKALGYHNAALILFIIVKDKSGEATSLVNISSVFYYLGEKQKTLKFYNAALSIYKAVGDRINEVKSLNNIGIVYDGLGEKQKALEYYNAALLLSKVVGDKGGEATSLNNIGSMYSSLGEKQKALEYYYTALPLYKAIGDKGGEAKALNNIGIVYYYLGQQQKALECFYAALPLRKAIRDRNGEAVTFYSLLYLWKDWSGHNNLPLAIFYGKQAVNIIQSLRADIKDLDKDLQRSFLNSNEGVYRSLADLLITQGRLPEAQQILSMLKEEEYFDFIRRDTTAGEIKLTTADYNEKETESNKRYLELTAQLTATGTKYDELNNKQSRTADEEQLLTKLESDLNIAKDIFQKFITEELPKELPNTREATERLIAIESSQALQQDLRELGTGTVAIYTVVTESKYRIILVTPTVQKASEYPISAADLNRKILAFREVLQNPSLDPLPLAQELYQILIGPIEQDLVGAKAETLMWSLDGTLRYLPMAALHDGKQYLLTKYRNTVFNIASNSRIKDPVQKHWKGLGFGFSKSNEQAQKDGFSPLPGVAEELFGIIKDENDQTKSSSSRGIITGTVKLDQEFTKETFTTLLRQRYPVIHIASHFQFRPGNEKNSFLLLGDGNHLDISQLRLLSFRDVDLLTLSACNTAMGDKTADGREIEGFGMMAQKQGAKAVLASLWSVADASTKVLMQEFYRYRETHPQASKAEAMQQAQLALLTGKIKATDSNNRSATPSSANEKNRYKFSKDAPYDHPYYWAPFILIGNWK